MNKMSRDKAIACGLSVYYTEKLCKRGHDSPRYVTNYHCVLCSKEDSQKPDTKEYQKQYRKSLKGKYVRHKWHAAERGIAFEISFEEWLSVWENSGYIEYMGNKKGYYVMSRYNDQGAYKVGNVFIQTFSENIAERNTTYTGGTVYNYVNGNYIRECDSNGQPLE